MIPPLPDYHTHTRFCRHASGEAIDYALAAAALALPEIACTDHIPFPDDPSPSIRMTLDEFPCYIESVQHAAAESPIPVLLGLETDHRSDLVTARHLDSLLAQADFDLVLGSLHTGPFWTLTPDDPAATPAFIESMWRTYFQHMTDLARSGLYDICAHFDLVKRRACRPSPSCLREMVLPALDAVAESGMAIELNTSGLIHDAKEIYPSFPILTWMAERDIPVTFGSDAHRPEDVARHFDQALETARAAGLTHRATYRRRRRQLLPL